MKINAKNNYVTRTLLEDLSTGESTESQTLSITDTKMATGGTIIIAETEGGVARTERGQASTFHVPKEILREWPEIIKVAEKLSSNKELNEQDKLWIDELAEATGWNKDDIVDELINISVNPSERTEKYRELFEKYYTEAQKHKERGDTRQAGEKLWGAVTALIKLHAATKGIPILHWSRGKLDRFVTSNVERRYRKLFRDLLDKAHRLHEHFYEGDLDKETFEERWKEVNDLLKEVMRIVLGRPP